MGRFLVLMLFVALGVWAPAAQAQYMYLDTNGDGANSAADVLAPNGTATTVDVWIRTNANRDGSPAFCGVDFTLPLDINSYVVNLEAVNGSVTFGNFINRRPQFNTNFGEINADGVHYKNGWGGPYRDYPGTYRLATLTIVGVSGSPGIRIVDMIPGSLDFTSFGTSCYGNDFDNTYKLAGPAGGSDWFDVDGTGGVDVTNRAPVLAPIGNKTGQPGTPLTFTATASDPDSPPQTVTFSLGLYAPAGASIDPSTGVFTWTPSANGTFYVTISVRDNGTPALWDFESILIEVTQPNAAPLLTPIGNKSAAELNLLTFTATATDPAGGGLTWTLEPGAPEGASIRPGNGLFEWYIAEQQAPGQYPITVKVTSNANGLSDSETILVNANEVNVPPHFTGGGTPITVTEGQTATQQLTAFDADIPVQTLAFFKSLGPPFALVSLSGLITVAPGYQDSGTYSLRVRVFDGILFGFDNIISITVLNADLSVFTTGGDKTIRLGSGKSEACVQMEPSGAAFDILDLDPASVRMTYGGSSIPAISGKTAVGTDKNQNGVDEMTACFSKENLRTLFAGLTGGEQSVAVVIEAAHASGAPVSGPVTLRVKAGGGQLLAIAPNPLNPSATATFSTSRSGSIRVALYDLHGRLVRTLLDTPSAPDGYHDVRIEGQDANGNRLASGVYYVKIRTVDGEVTKAITILR